MPSGQVYTVCVSNSLIIPYTITIGLLPKGKIPVTDKESNLKMNPFNLLRNETFNQ
jgi:hypothetical protein